MKLISQHLAEVTVDDIRRRFSTIEILDEQVFAAELQQYILESVSMLAQGLPYASFSEHEATYKPAGWISELPAEAHIAALRRNLSRKANALIAATPWKPDATDLQRGRAILIKVFSSPSNMSVQNFAKRAGKVRQQIYEDIKARRLLTISIGPRKHKVPDWQLDQTKIALTRSVLAAAPDIDNWTIYKALSEPLASLGKRSPVEIVEISSVDNLTKTVLSVLGIIPAEASP
jgi:hypothetical protein